MMNTDRKSKPGTIGGPKIASPGKSGKKKAPRKTPRIETIGGPKITGADPTGKYVVDLKVGEEQVIDIYNDTDQERDWVIAMPLNMPAWLQISSGNWTLGAGAAGQVTVKVASSANPPSVSVKFGWKPPFNEPTDNTLVVNIIPS